MWAPVTYFVSRAARSSGCRYMNCQPGNINIEEHGFLGEEGSVTLEVAGSDSVAVETTGILGSRVSPNGDTHVTEWSGVEK